MMSTSLILFTKSNLSLYTTLSMDIPWRTCYACGYEGYFTARCPQCATVQ